VGGEPHHFAAAAGTESQNDKSRLLEVLNPISLGVSQSLLYIIRSISWTPVSTPLLSSDRDKKRHFSTVAFLDRETWFYRWLSEPQLLYNPSCRMKRIIALWFILFLTNLLVRPAINYFIFNHLDARYEAYVHLVVAPLAEVVLLAAALGLITSRSVLTPLRTIGKPTPAGLFLVVDGLVLLLTLMPGLPQWMRLVQTNGLANFYIGSKAVAGGILVIWGSFYRRWTDWDRRWLMLIGVVLCAYGVDYLTPWLAALLRPFVANWGQLVGWLYFYGPLFVLVLLLLTRLETLWNRHSVEAGFMVGYAAGFAVVGATIVGLNAFNRPYLLEPWASVAKACSFLTLTAVVAGSIVAGLSFRGTEAGGDSDESMVDDLRTHKSSQEVLK